MLGKLEFRVVQVIILHRKAGSGNGHSRTIAPNQRRAGYGIKPSSKTITSKGRERSCKNRLGDAKEKPPDTTSLTKKGHPCQYRHGWPTWGASYVAAKTIFQASPTRGGSLGAVRLLCQQAETTRGWPSKTISGPKKTASKTMWEQELNSHGREIEGVCKRMDKYNQGSFCIWNNTRASVTVQQKVP